MFRFVVLLSALVVIVLGILGTDSVVRHLLGGPKHASSEAVVSIHKTSSPTVAPLTVVVVTEGPKATATARPRPTTTATPAPPRVAMNVSMTNPGPTQGMAALQGNQTAWAPVASATPGTVTLSNYWISPRSTRSGTQIAFTFVVSNGTGETVRLWLGASIMPAAARDWIMQSISDPAHDVVATIPPGVTTHIRYFTIPRRTVPGWYDVAWGLKSLPGQSVTFVAVPRELDVQPSG